MDSILTKSLMFDGSSKLGVAIISVKHSNALSMFLSRKPIDTNKFSFLSKKSVVLGVLVYLSI